MKLMRIIQVGDREVWDKFILANRGSFLQSWSWGEFKKTLGLEVKRFILTEGKKWLLASQIFKMPLKWNLNYFYVPRGPVGNLKFGILNSESLFSFFRELEPIAEKEKTIFLRFDPELESVSFLGKNKKMRLLHQGVQPEHTLILDLSEPLEVLRRNLRQRARYNIRRAQRHRISVKVFQVSDPSFAGAFEQFYSLIKETCRRSKIRLYGRPYFENLLKILGDSAALSVAYAERRPVAANLLIFWGKRVTYLYGGSTSSFGRLGAPYYLHWRQITEAKKKGFREYDFWGIASKDARGQYRPRKWEGITFFKESFGGRRVSYIGALDWVFNRKFYLLYRAVKAAPLPRLSI